MAFNLRSISNALPTLTKARPANRHFAVSSASPQCIHARSVSILSSIRDNPGAYGHKIRVGRGPSSGRGKTSGRGHKGQKQHGKVPAGFEGGQTPLRFTQHQIKYGNIHRKEYAPVPLSRILSWIAQGRIDPTKPITPKELLMSRCVHEITDGIKLLASSQRHNASLDEIPPLTMPLNIVVSRASASAIAAVEAAGGSVVTRYYTNFALRNIVKGNMDSMHSLLSLAAPLTVQPKPVIEKDGKTFIDDSVDASSLAPIRAPWAMPALPAKEYKYRLPDPAGRKEIEYYRDPLHRGYLNYMVGEGEGPSLFYKKPTSLGGSYEPPKKKVAVKTDRLF